MLLIVLTFATSSCEVNNNNSSNNSVNEEQPPIKNYSFDSYDELLNALKYPKNLLTNEENSKEYKLMLDILSKDREALKVPKKDNENIAFRNLEGLSNITVMPDELFSLPWIWYYFNVENTQITIKTSYIKAMDEKHIGSTYRQIVEDIYPDAPLPSNYQNFENYKIIYEKEIVLDDGYRTYALFYETNDSERISVAFVYEDLMVSIKTYPKLISDSFFSSLSFCNP